MIGICGDERCLCRQYREPVSAPSDDIGRMAREFAAKHGISLEETESQANGVGRGDELEEE